MPGPSSSRSVSPASAFSATSVSRAAISGRNSARYPSASPSRARDARSSHAYGSRSANPRPRGWRSSDTLRWCQSDGDDDVHDRGRGPPRGRGPRSRTHAPRGVAVLCHPHPRHGGSKDHPLLWAIRNDLAASRGVAVLGFNFRGRDGVAGQLRRRPRRAPRRPRRGRPPCESASPRTSPCSSWAGRSARRWRCARRWTTAASGRSPSSASPCGRATCPCPRCPTPPTCAPCDARRCSWPGEHDAYCPSEELADLRRRLPRRDGHDRPRDRPLLLAARTRGGGGRGFVRRAAPARLGGRVAGRSRPAGRAAPPLPPDERQEEHEDREPRDEHHRQHGRDDGARDASRAGRATVAARPGPPAPPCPGRARRAAPPSRRSHGDAAARPTAAARPITMSQNSAGIRRGLPSAAYSGTCDRTMIRGSVISSIANRSPSRPKPESLDPP